jgi:hypothetical protein
MEEPIIFYCEPSPSTKTILRFYADPTSPNPSLEETAAEWGITPEELRKKIEEQN